MKVMDVEKLKDLLILKILKQTNTIDLDDAEDIIFQLARSENKMDVYFAGKAHAMFDLLQVVKTLGVEKEKL